MSVLVCVCAGSSTSGKLSIPLNVNLYDGRGETPLGLALWTKQFDVARQLLEAGVWWEQRQMCEWSVLPAVHLQGLRWRR